MVKLHYVLLRALHKTFPLCIALSQHTHTAPSLFCLWKPGCKELSEVSLLGLLSEFIHPKNRLLSLQTLTISLFPFSQRWHSPWVQSSTRSALGLHIADVAHLPVDQGSLCRGPGAWDTVWQPGSVCHVLPTISFLMLTLPQAKIQTEDWGCSIEGNISAGD